MSLIKVAWYVTRVKNMQLWSPSDPSQNTAAEAKPRYVYSISQPHGQSSKSPIWLLLREVKPSYVYTILKKLHLPRVGPKQLCVSAHLGCTCATEFAVLLAFQCLKFKISENLDHEWSCSRLKKHLAAKHSQLAKFGGSPANKDKLEQPLWVMVLFFRHFGFSILNYK